MRCRIFKYLYYLSYEQLLFKRKKQFFIVCFVMHIRRCRVEQDWSTRPRIQTETKKNLEPQQSRLLHMLIRGQILEDTLYVGVFLANVYTQNINLWVNILLRIFASRWIFWDKWKECTKKMHVIIIIIWNYL